MVSSYLELPIRSLEQALWDRARVRGERLERGPGTPAGPTVNRNDPIGVQIRLLAKNPTPPGGRRTA